MAETTLEQQIATLGSPSDPAVECQPHKKQGGCQRLIRLGLHRRITHMHTKCIAPSLTWPKKAAKLPRPRVRGCVLPPCAVVVLPPSGAG